MVKEVNEQNFDQEVLKSPVPVLVDFWAEWCGPCRMLSPVIEKLSNMYPEDKLKVVKLNVDESPTVASRYGIMAIPTVIIFKNGVPIERVTGVRGEKEYISIISRVI